MIRKTIIVVLTLGAIGSLVLVLVPHRQRLLKVGENPTLAIAKQSRFTLEANYGNKRDPSDCRACWSTYRRTWLAGGGWCVREGRWHRYAGGALGFEVSWADFPATYGDEGREYAVFAVRLDVPLWFPFVIFAFYPILAFIRGPLRRYRRRKRALCVRCGYNLTGLTEPRCPECGTEDDAR